MITLSSYLEEKLGFIIEVSKNTAQDFECSVAEERDPIVLEMVSDFVVSLLEKPPSFNLKVMLEKEDRVGINSYFARCIINRWKKRADRIKKERISYFEDLSTKLNLADEKKKQNLSIQICDELCRLVSKNQTKIAPQLLAFFNLLKVGFDEAEICRRLQIHPENYRKVLSKLRKRLNELFPNFIRREFDLT